MRLIAIHGEDEDKQWLVASGSLGYKYMMLAAGRRMMVGACLIAVG